MNAEKIYNALDSNLSSEEKRSIIVDYLVSCIDKLLIDGAGRRKVAYDIAGLLSTSYAQELQEDEPINTVLTLAGELEINNGQPNDSWNHFVDLVKDIQR